MRFLRRISVALMLASLIPACSSSAGSDAASGSGGSSLALGGGASEMGGGTSIAAGGSVESLGGSASGGAGGDGATGSTTGGASTGGTSTGGATSTCSQAEEQIRSNEIGTHCGYTYEYWKDSGDGLMLLKSGGNFSIEWSGIGNLLARKGLRPGSMNQVVTFSANYTPNGNSYLGVYGWTTSDLVEYYIIENWGNWRPPGDEGYQGTFQTSEGDSYDLYLTMRYNQPSIQETQTFPQFWSVRQLPRSSGTVRVFEHFSAWASHGMNMGSLYEVSMVVEGYQSSGYADVALSME